MIRIRVRKNSGHIAQFQVDGHAGYGEYGQDIVCSAVSAIVISSINGLILHAEIDPECEQAEGHVSCNVSPDESWSDLKWAVVDGILNTMVSGLESIKDQYPKAVSIVIEDI